MLKPKVPFFILSLFIAGCTVGPDYHRPDAPVPNKYKELRPGWKWASPQNVETGPWWEIFKDPVLNDLEKQVAISNQNLAAAEAQYRQSLAVVDQARAAFYPVVGSELEATRQKRSTTGGGTFTTPGTNGSTIPSPVSNGSNAPSGTSPISVATYFSSYLLSVNASWVPDIWGNVRRQVEADLDAAEASAAQVAQVQLTAQATLAEDYFQLRTLDRMQELLDRTVVSYQKALDLTIARYKVGVAALADVSQAQTQLNTAEVQATDNGINRATFEHAIAVLIGLPPENFSITPSVKALAPPSIPYQIPSVLLERRPDIAHAERQMAQANALIGVAIAAFYPTVTLSAAGGFQTNQFSQWFSWPSSFWSLGAELAETIFEGGLRRAQVAAARENYENMVATYRQTVLNAFQNVEDNLVALNILQKELKEQRQAVKGADLSLRLLVGQYTSGTVPYTNVITNQTTLYSNQISEINITGRQMIAAVGLITSLGGGWEACSVCLPKSP